MGKSPAFRFYPGDFMGSPDVQVMDLSEVGAYVLLLCIAWQQDRHGCLPDDENKLRRWARMRPEQWAISREILLGKFPVIESGLRGNPRMIREAQKQAEFSAKQAKNGRQGGRPQKAVGSENKPMALETKANQNPEPPKIKPSVSAVVSAVVSDVLSASEVSSREKPKATAGAVPFVLPEWIDSKTWNDFEVMRKKKRAPMTDRARELVIDKLKAFEAKGISSTEVLNESVLNGWNGVFEPKSSNGNSADARQKRNRETVERINRENSRRAMAEQRRLEEETESNSQERADETGGSDGEMPAPT